LLVGIGVGVFINKRHSTAAAPQASSDSRPVPVLATTATLTDVPLVLEGLGNVASLATVVVRTQIDGRLDKILFKEGQTVKKGQLLALVDARPYQIQLLNAQAALSRDTAQLQNGRLNLERYRTLRGQNLISQQQIDDQQTLVTQTEAATNADQSAISAAKLQIDFTRITSPIDGVTGVRQIDQGNLVRAADSTGIVVVTQLDPIGVLFTVPEDNQLRISQALANGPVQVDAFSRDGQTLLSRGTLLVMDNQINATTATIRLKATFANPTKTLWPNAFVKARLVLGTRRGVISIPAPAVQQGPRGTFVYLIASDQTAVARDVQVDFTQGDIAVIAKGLVAGDYVVTEGQGQLRPGAKVAVRTPSTSNDNSRRSSSASDATASSSPSNTPIPDNRGTR
jgi:multidrug efflux system membrane fusion protein